MHGPSKNLCVAALLLVTLSACGTVKGLTGGDEPGASSEAEARNVKPEDPLARPVQVGWTSARASHCGFIFDPDQLRAQYLAAEAQTGASPAQMKKVEQAYDYTRNSVLETIRDKLGYCHKERTDAIRMDLKRYLAGDFRPAARLAR